MVTESDGILLRDGKCVGVEGEVGESLVDVLLDELERSVNAETLSIS